MKKIILAVILLAAAGGIIYYLLEKKKQNSITVIDKELVIGKWKVDSLVAQKDSSKDGLVLLLFAIDSNARNLVYDFQTDGKVLASLPSDSTATKDTSSFSWGNGKAFLWKEKITDSTADTMMVIKLNKKDFVLQSLDSTLIYLKKVK